MNRPSPKISITIPRELLNRVEMIASHENRSKSNAIAQLLREGLSIHHKNELPTNEMADVLQDLKDTKEELHRVAEAAAKYSINPISPGAKKEEERKQ